MPTTIGPFIVQNGTAEQLDMVTEAWSYCTYETTGLDGTIDLWFKTSANMPDIPNSTSVAWGYTYWSIREVWINEDREPREIRYAIIHELGHMVDGDKMRAPAGETQSLDHQAIMDLMTPDFGYDSWRDGPYKYSASECFAHLFAKALYVDPGYTWQNVLNTTYKRTIDPADYTATRNIVENAIPGDSSDPDTGDIPVGETRTYFTTKDASVIITDTFVPSDSSPNTSNWNGATMLDGYNGDDQHHPVGHLRGTGWNYYSRAFVYFPISFTGAQTVDDSIMWIMQRARGSGHAWATAAGDITIRVRRVLRDFAETPKHGEGLWKDTSNNTTNFRKRGMRYSSEAGNPMNWTTQHEVVKTFKQADLGWVPIDITDITKDWFDHSKGLRNDAPNYGVIISVVDEHDELVAFDFFSREATDSTRIPYLDMTINANVAPFAPINLAPTANALQNTLSPVFTGAASDPDPGDYISAVQIKVFKNDGTTIKWDSGTINVTGQPSTFSITYGQVTGIVPPGSVTGNTSYKWQARTADKAGVWGPWSTLQQFKLNTAPRAPQVTILETPLNDVKSSTPTIVVTHSDADPQDTKAYGYQVEVRYAGSTFYTTGPVDLASIDRATTVNVTLPTLAPPDGNPWGKSYQVRARTKDSNSAWGAYSSWLDFTTHMTLVPINLNPSSDTTTPTSTPLFTGERGDTSDIITAFRIFVYDDSLSQIWDSGDLTSTISDAASFSTTYAGAAMPTGAFYQWKVRVTSSVGGNSNYSELQRFQTPSDVTVPTLTAPVGNGIVGGGSNPLRPAFVGERAGTFNRFQVEVYPSTSTVGNLGSSIYASGTLSSTISGSGPYVFTMAADTVTALTWATNYKWRARVSADAGSSWSAWTGLVSFKMDVAATPTLTAPSTDQWITDDTPTFTIARGGSDTIDLMQVLVYAANQTTLIWDSTMTNVANGTTASLDYSGPTLAGGYYWWQARYTKTTGPTGNYSTKSRFRLNYPPDIPTSLQPQPGAVLDETLIPVFEALFSDNDVSVVGDYPTEWEIVIETVSPNTLFTTKNITDDLLVGVNQYTYSGSPAMSYGTDYQWKTRYKDSKGVWGGYSGYRTFKPQVRPSSTTILPSNTSTITSIRPTASWTYVSGGGSAQASARFDVYEVIDTTDTANPPDRLVGTENETLAFKGSSTLIGTGTSHTLSETLFVNGKVYEVVLTVKNADGLEDPTPQVARWYVNLDAPDPITGLSPTANPDWSYIELNWDTVASLKTQHIFKYYTVYKRLVGDSVWQYVDQVSGIENSFYRDYRAGNDVLYEYRVTITTTKTGAGIELESGDDPAGGNTCEAQVDFDGWMFVGQDRDFVHILQLPVGDEDHTRIIQQEQFEPLGSDRKVIIRGFVLGYEGQISMTFENAEVVSPTDYQVMINLTILGRRLLDYLTSNKGPHLLKSPFGDVWEAQFEGPSYKWLPAGHLQVSVNWIETGATNQVSI